MTARYKIGVTEAGDAGLDLSWEEKLDTVDGAILITKRVTNDFISAVLRHKDNIIVHATCTGYGSTIIEPNVPDYLTQINAAAVLVKNGFPAERVVIRVDPIIPTEKGWSTAAHVMRMASFFGFSRYRISVIDMYPHVRKRFAAAGLPDPYKGKFQPPDEMMDGIHKLVHDVASFYIIDHGSIDGLRIETCAEPRLRDDGIIRCGCVSGYDLKLLGLDAGDVDQNGYQRKNCMCYSGKVELLNNKRQCWHGCLYCYWK